MNPTYRFRITARASSSRLSSTMPFSCTDPSEHRSNPAHNPSNVVFPLPDGPTIAIVEPASTVKLICSSTVNTRPAALYVLLILLTFKIVSMYLCITPHPSICCSSVTLFARSSLCYPPAIILQPPRQPTAPIPPVQQHPSPLPTTENPSSSSATASPPATASTPIRLSPPSSAAASTPSACPTRSSTRASAAKQPPTERAGSTGPSASTLTSSFS